MSVRGRETKERREETEMWEKELMPVFDSNLLKSSSELFPLMLQTPFFPSLFLFFISLKNILQIVLWLGASFASQKVFGKRTLLVGMMLSLTLLNTGSGDADLGYRAHQLTFRRAPKRHSWRMKAVSLPKSLSVTGVRLDGQRSSRARMSAFNQ